MLSDENCLDDRRCELAFEASAMNDARPVRVLVERSIEAQVLTTLRTFHASIGTSLSA